MSPEPWHLAVVLGAVVGSFLNVLADRLPDGKSLIRPSSHCPACRRRLKPLELIPLISYVALRGRCRACDEAIPIRVFAVEFAAAALFGLFVWRYGLSLRAAISAIYASLLIAFFVIDLERGLVPNRLVVPALALAALALPISGWAEPGFTLLGGALSFGVLLTIALVASGGMGMGDVKLGAFLGLILGYPQIIPGLLLAFIVGGATAGALLVSGRLKRDDPIPFGPFMAGAGILFLLYGDAIQQWWLGGILAWN